LVAIRRKNFSTKNHLYHPPDFGQPAEHDSSLFSHNAAH
jgi:hypothetical protein